MSFAAHAAFRAALLLGTQWRRPRAFCQHVARHDACGHERCAAGAWAGGCRQAVMAATSAPGVLAARAGRPAGARGRFRALAGRSPASAVATSGRADAGAGSPGIR